MKKIFIIFALAFSHFFNVYGQKEKLDQLFDKYQEVEGVTSIKIAKPMFGMLSSLNIEDSQLDQIKPLLSKINGLKVLITENPEGTDNSEGRKVKANLSQINKDISSYLKNLNYNEIMTVNNSGSKIKFLSSEAREGILDDLLLSIDSGGGESVLVMLDGKLSVDDINKIINASETKAASLTNNSSGNTKISENTTSYLNGESRNVGQFTGIHVSTGVNLIYKQENPTNIKVLADADKLQYIITKVENGVLKVYIDTKGVKNLKFKNLSVNVSSPEMNNIKVSSGANFTVVNALKEKNMEMEVSSGANLNGKFAISNATNIKISSGANMNATLNSTHLMLKSSSGSNAKLVGQVDNAIFDISSGALCKAEDLVLKNAQVEVTSGSNISLNVTDSLNVKASSGGSVRYKGNPRIESNISKTSGGSLKQIN